MTTYAGTKDDAERLNPDARRPTNHRGRRRPMTLADHSALRCPECVCMAVPDKDRRYYCSNCGSGSHTFCNR
jgi:hypothetical protein